jgi:hypothetical protein
MAAIFDKLLLQGVRSGQAPARTKAARSWFRNIASEITSNRVTPNKMLADTSRMVPGVEPGKMYHFRYDPKLKQTLPYYDKFPLIFMVGPAQGGFYGINLHYLPFKLRAKLMDSLYTISSNRKFDESTQLALSYNVLSSASKFKYFKPTFKHYLYNHVQSSFMLIHPTEWDIALMLPTQRFAKASTYKVYSDSREMI